MFWNKYPYTNFHELNLDWILQQIKSMEKSLSEFEALNKITFDGEWDITKQYPAWCIVNTNGGTEGYISIQPVPAGVVITNTDYWVSVVNYTATIADLQNRVVALESDVADLQAVTSEILINSNSDIIALGDSWALTGGWTDQLEGYLPHKTFRKAGTGGIGFIGGAFKNQLSTIAAAMTADEKDDIDLIIQSCSINDLGNSYADIQAAVVDYIDYAQATFQNAKILIVNVNKWFIGVWNRQPYFAAAQNATESYANVFYMDVTNSYAWNSFVDGAHINTDGYNKVAKAIYTKLMGGSCGLNTEYELIPFYIGYGDNGNTYYKQATAEIRDGVATVRIPTYEYSSLSVTASIITSITGSIKGMTGYETENMLTGLRFQAIAFITATDNTSYTLPVTIDITGGGVITHTIITPTDLRGKTIRNMYIDNISLTVNV